MRVVELEDAVVLKTDSPEDHIEPVDLSVLQRQGVSREMLAIAASFIERRSQKP